MPKTIAWTDGASWSVDDGTFRRVTEQLRGLEEAIMGLAPILSRWSDLAAQGERLAVDTFAPTEDDRAVLTAALARALEEARSGGAAGLGFDDAGTYRAYLGQLEQLHELFMTDVTREYPRSRRRR